MPEDKMFYHCRHCPGKILAQKGGSAMSLIEALYYETREDQQVRCRLCPHHCLIDVGASGICQVRSNRGGQLYTENYGAIAALALDPVEKKPLYHFYPGRQILSAGTWGCNFACPFCQNYHLAHERAATREIMPEQLVRMAVEAGQQDSIGIAFTYNEPTIWFEYVLETARLLREEGLKAVLVTNGFIDPEPLNEILPFIDAANIDLKAFQEDFYRRTCKGRLQEVKDSIVAMAGKIHVELTHLLIPGENDDPAETEAMAAWIAGIDPLIPLHLSRYHPAYKMEKPATEFSAMAKARDILHQYLKFVYLGNLPGISNDTPCIECGQPLIHRSSYRTETGGIKAGRCEYCGAHNDHIKGI
jgi:pyruvate formate lyase activating enzyme